jgi:uncharacterized membrane protein YeaQ/YmgE (transglycosylase-associated protein family)
MGAEEEALRDKSVDLNTLQALRLQPARAEADEKKQRQSSKHRVFPGTLSIGDSVLSLYIILGILGGVVGGWVFGLLGIWPGGGMIGSIIVAFVGAVISVGISRLLKKG